jgi:hypothetical protein
VDRTALIRPLSSLPDKHRRWILDFARLLSPMDIAIAGELREGFTVLGYTDDWLELGIASEALIATQLAEWRRPEGDKNPEHYRYAAWRGFAANVSQLSISLLERLLALDLHEASRASTAFSSFGHSIAYDLADHRALTKEGLDRLRRHPVRSPSFSRQLDRAAARFAATGRNG